MKRKVITGKNMSSMNYIRKCGDVFKKIRKKSYTSEKGTQERNAMGFY